MKTRKDQLMDFFKGVFCGICVIALLVLTVGCSKKNDRNNGRSGNPYWYDPRYGGPGYGGHGNVSHVAMGIEGTTGSSLILAVSQDPMAPQGGQAWIEGDMEITQPVPCGIGGTLPPGIYRLFPYQGQPGAFSNGMLTAAFEAHGPGGMVFVNVPFGSIFTTNVCGFLGLSASVEIYVPTQFQPHAYCTSMFVSDVGQMCR